jgi:PAS domain S-box-containing protein
MSTRRLHFGKAYLVVAIAVSLGAILLAARSLVVSRDYATRNAEVQSQNLARAIDQNLASTLTRIDHTLLSVTGEMERGLATGGIDRTRLDGLLAREEALLPEAVALRVSDADGAVILGNPSADPAASFADRPYFPFLRDHPQAGVFVTKPIVGKFTRRWVITSARRYQQPDGSFGGVVVAPVFLEHFQKVLAGFDVGRGGTLTLCDTDGGFVASHPAAADDGTPAVGARTYSSELLATFGAEPMQRDHTVTAATSQSRGTLTFQRVAGAPLFVVVSLAEEDYLAQWRVDRLTTLLMVLLFLAGVWIATGFLWFSWKRHEGDANRLRTILQTAMDGFWQTDTEGRLLEANETYCRMSGYSRAELLAMRIPDLTVTEGVGGVAQHIDRIVARGQDRFESRHRRKDGTQYDVEVSVQYQPGAGGQLVTFVRDITEHKRAEEALRQSEQKYRRLHESMTDAFVLVDMAGHILECNQSYRDMLGFSAAELSKVTYQDLTPEKWRAFESRIVEEQILPQGFSGVYEKEYRRKNGMFFPVELRTSLIRDADGQPSAMWAIVRDVSERKQAEAALRESAERLRQSEKLEAIGQLAGGVAHDFNNQLAGIVNYADLLLTMTQNAEPRGAVEGILRLCARSSDLTSKLLAFSRKGKYRTVPVNIHECVAEVSALLERSVDKRIRIRQCLDAQPPTTIGDPTQLVNALLNLGLNARDAMPTGGELRFATDLVTLDRERCASSRFDMAPGDYVRIAVTDSGTGMDAPTQARLFEPFFTTKEPGKGTGLGLASVHGTVVNHHGAIAVHSELGKGTTMTLLLPLLRQDGPEGRTAAEPPGPEGSAEPAPRPTAHARILIADDEEIVREFTAKLLRRQGHSVLTATDGSEAVDCYRRSWPDIDLVILDMNMPKMNGRDAFAAMRVINPQLRAILATGYSLDGDVQGMLEDGVLAYIHKPFRIQDLNQQVAWALGRGPDCPQSTRNQAIRKTVAETPS